MESPADLHVFRFRNVGLVLAVLFLLSFSLAPAAHAQQASADIQETADNILSSDLRVETDPGQTVVIELFATGFDGAIGVKAILDLDNPTAVASVAGDRKLGFDFPPTPVKLTGSQLTFEEGGLRAASETGSNLKLVGVVRVTLAGTFTTLNLTLSSLEISYLTKPAVKLTPNTKLIVVNAATVPRTLQVDLDIAEGNQNLLSGRFNPGQQVVAQLFASGLRNLLAYEVHAVVDTPAIDIKNIQFFARAPFTVTPAGTGVFPTAAASASSKGGVDLQIATSGGQGDGTYSTSSLEVTTTGGTSASPTRVALEIYGTGVSQTSGFEARFKVDNPVAIQSVSARESTTFPTPGSARLEGNQVILSVSSGVVNITDAQPKLLGTLLITLSSNFNGLSISLPSITFLPGNEVITTNAVLNIKPTAGVAASTTEIQGRTVIGRASAPTGAKGSDVRLGRFQFLTGRDFRGGTITITKMVFMPGGIDPITITPNITLNLSSVVTDAPIVTAPPVPVTVTGNRALIQWTTNKPSTSRVIYGTSSSTLSQQADKSELATVHRVVLENLSLNTQYYFQVTNTDAQSRTSSPYPTNPNSFTTRNQIDVLAPKILEGPATV
ncbi:MAG: fibronectin type III domain-containing protein, partial [bacterium]|nr:fibronectin type III domain-containing protein [bacterium]